MQHAFENPDAMVARHGDMLIYKISDEEFANMTNGSESREKENLTVGLGEVSGHSHTILAGEDEDGNVGVVREFAEGKSYDNMDRDIAFKVEGTAAVLTHDEHKEIVLQPGNYVRVIQREYNAFEKSRTIVRD